MSNRGTGRVYRQRGGNGRESPNWWIDFSPPNGPRVRESAHTTKKGEAQRLLRQRLTAYEDGKIVGRPNQVTLGDLRKGLEDHYALEGNRSLKRAQQAFQHLEAFLGADTPALKVTKQRVREYVKARLEATPRSPASGTVRYEVAILRTAFSVAVDADLLAVCPAFKMPAAGKARRGFFETADFAALIVELPSHVQPVVRFLRMTGWRKGEALGLTWEQVDWQRNTVVLHAEQTKGKDERVFPFGHAPELLALLKEQWAQRRGPFVFHLEGQPIVSLRAAWKHACARAGLTGKLVHDLRRTAARDFRDAGVSEGEIMKLCGWKTRAMFDRYNIISPADLAGAVEKRFGIRGAYTGVVPEPGASLSSVPASTAA